MIKGAYWEKTEQIDWAFNRGKPALGIFQCASRQYWGIFFKHNGKST